MTLKTTIKHLHMLQSRFDATGATRIPTRQERRALTEAIAWLAGERRREVRADLRGRVIDHLDGNPRNMKLSNLRVATMPENNR